MRCMQEPDAKAGHAGASERAHPGTTSCIGGETLCRHSVTARVRDKLYAPPCLHNARSEAAEEGDDPIVHTAQVLAVLDVELKSTLPGRVRFNHLYFFVAHLDYVDQTAPLHPITGMQHLRHEPDVTFAARDISDGLVYDVLDSDCVEWTAAVTPDYDHKGHFWVMC
jgi:hypothetical protein